MEYQARQGVVVYRSKMHATLKRNYQVLPGAAWLKLLLQHEAVDEDQSRAARSRWARLLRKVYEVEPLTCPHCGGEMRVIAVIEEAPVIERILRHVGVWEPTPPLRAPPEEAWPTGSQIPLTYHPVPDIA